MTPSALSTTGYPSSARGRERFVRGRRLQGLAGSARPASASEIRAHRGSRHPVQRGSAGAGSSGTPVASRPCRSTTDERTRSPSRCRDRRARRPRAAPARAPPASTSSGRAPVRPGLGRGASESARGLGLRFAQLVRGRAVAAEIAGQQDRVDLARLEQQPRHALVRAEVLLAGAGEVDRVGRRRRRRHYRREPRRQTLPRAGKLEPGGAREVGRDDRRAARRR